MLYGWKKAEANSGKKLEGNLGKRKLNMKEPNPWVSILLNWKICWISYGNDRKHCAMIMTKYVKCLNRFGNEQEMNRKPF